MARYCAAVAGDGGGAMKIVLVLGVFFVLLCWSFLLTILVNMALANYRERKRHGWEMEPITRDFIEFCKVTLMVSIWLGGW